MEAAKDALRVADVRHHIVRKDNAVIDIVVYTVLAVLEYVV